jgi:hypothetical protein
MTPPKIAIHATQRDHELASLALSGTFDKKLGAQCLPSISPTEPLDILTQMANGDAVRSFRSC